MGITGALALALSLALGLGTASGLSGLLGQLDKRSFDVDFAEQESAEKTKQLPPLPPRNVKSGVEPPGAAAARSVMESRSASPTRLWTETERTSFWETGRYDEVVAMAAKLKAASPFVRVRTIGQTSQGRDLLLFIISTDNAFTPAAARRTGKPVVLIQNGIHAGEIAGKDATLMLLRDMLMLRSQEHLLKGATLLVLPVFNVDGHERRSQFNRINQSGPFEMGWRATAQRLNLNRDFAKADTPEMRAWLAMYRAWLPELTIDNHTTDGADYQYDVTLHMPVDQDIWPTLGRWADREFLPGLIGAMEADGHVVSRYVGLGQDDESTKGVVQTLYTPRFGNGYAAARNRQCLLVETHSLKSYRTQVWAHYDVLRHALEGFAKAPNATKAPNAPKATNALTRAVSEADAAIAGLGERYQPETRLHLDGKIAADQPEQGVPYTFKGIESRTEQSAVSGATYRIYGTRPANRETRLFAEAITTVSASVPLAYAFPPEWRQLAELLTLHGIHIERLAQDRLADVELQRFRHVSWSPFPFEGHHRLNFDVERETQLHRTIPKGWFLVPMHTRDARLALNLLEPEAPDSLVRWGLFDTIFEQKEDYSDYLMEKLAQQMLRRDPALKSDFDARLATDPDFARNPRARLNFFYVRSPYFETDKNVYPVLRVIRY